MRPTIIRRRRASIGIHRVSAPVDGVDLGLFTEYPFLVVAVLILSIFRRSTKQQRTEIFGTQSLTTQATSEEYSLKLSCFNRIA
ncbi:hypothetical protein BDW62DRAFT_172528, partial [Aspergillus aurantiobrunneus]